MGCEASKVVSISAVMTYLGEPPTLGQCRRALATQPLDEIIEVKGDGVKTESQDIAEGFRQASGDWILTTNADCYIPPGFVRTMARWLNSGYDMASGVRVPSHFGLPRHATSKMSPGSGVTGSGLLFDRRILEGVLPFRFRTAWDIELALRSGARIVIDPSAKIVHDDPYTASRFTHKAVNYIGRNGAMVFSFGGFQSVCPVPAAWRRG